MREREREREREGGKGGEREIWYTGIYSCIVHTYMRAFHIG